MKREVGAPTRATLGDLVSPSSPDLHLQQAQQGSKLCLTAQDQGPGLKGLTAFGGYRKLEPVFSKNKSRNSIQKKA